VNLGALFRLFDVNGARRNVDADNLTNLFALLTNRVVRSEICLLVREGISIGRNLSLEGKTLDKA
jgi:hypothetical protein